jgi:hypothetical protein
MNAFVSYSHQDAAMLDLLHKHLSQLQRDKIITTWTDRDIDTGAPLNPTIAAALTKSKLFLALLSPDYLASHYCYDVEFNKAQERQDKGDLIIVPIIIEPCDWLNSPFSQLKAVPRDGKPISTWDNRNTAFLDVIQNLRRLATAATAQTIVPNSTLSGTPPTLSRNYRVKQDFDTIQRNDFVSKTFTEISTYLKRYIEEVITLDGIKVQQLKDETTQIEFILVNRNKVKTEARLTLSINMDQRQHSYMASNTGQLGCAIAYTSGNDRETTTSDQFSLEADEYHLFWASSDYFNQRDKKELDAKAIADMIYDKWLESVGIM